MEKPSTLCWLLIYSYYIYTTRCPAEHFKIFTAFIDDLCVVQKHQPTPQNYRKFVDIWNCQIHDPLSQYVLLKPQNPSIEILHSCRFRNVDQRLLRVQNCERVGRDVSVRTNYPTYPRFFFFRLLHDGPLPNVWASKSGTRRILCTSRTSREAI